MTVDDPPLGTETTATTGSRGSHTTADAAPALAAARLVDPSKVAREVQNCTPDRLTVIAEDRRLQLSPLGSTPVDDEAIAAFALHELSNRQVVRLIEYNPTVQEAARGVLLTFGFWGAVIGVVVYVIANSWIAAVAAFAGMLIVGWIVVAAVKKRLPDIANIVSLLVVVALGIGLPIAVLVIFGDLPRLLDDTNSPELFARLSQSLWIVLAAVLPTSLYFIFDRQRAQTIRHTFQRQILRLDPTIATLYDIDAKYGDLMIEAIGAERGPRTRATRSTPAPIFIAAVLIALGWMLTLPVVDNQPGQLSNDPLAAYFTPERHAYVFGFLGTYFFSINLVARRYVRGDLRPKTYGTIAVRILTVFILSWVLEVAFAPDDWVYIAAFLIGILPETFFTLIAETQRALLGTIAGAMREPHPLTKLEGIDLYDRSRLQDEGVNNVEALAHHDLIELMLATRIPVPRLVDWVDQAILYLHTVDQDGEPIGRDHLRSYGIRTASDLIAVHADQTLWTQLIADDVPPGRLALVQAAVRDDEWVQNVLAWRQPRTTQHQHLKIEAGQLI